MSAPATESARAAARGTTVVGRDRELVSVERCLDESAAGANTLVFDGAAGIGKTALFDRARQLAGERGWTGLSARPAEPEAHLTYAALSDLLAAVPPAVIGELAGPERQALDVALLRAEPEGGALPSARSRRASSRS